MKIVEENVSIEVADDLPEHTIRFLRILLKMMHKGIGNPAFQLHSLSMLVTGKPFVTLVAEGEKPADLVMDIEMVTAAFLDVMKRSGHTPPSSGMTIDDILGNNV